MCLNGGEGFPFSIEGNVWILHLFSHDHELVFHLRYVDAVVGPEGTGSCKAEFPIGTNIHTDVLHRRLRVQLRLVWDYAKNWDAGLNDVVTVCKNPIGQGYAKRVPVDETEVLVQRKHKLVDGNAGNNVFDPAGAAPAAQILAGVG